MKFLPPCFRMCHHLGWILGQTFRIRVVEEVHREGREHCGSCDWRPVKIRISNTGLGDRLSSRLGSLPLLFFSEFKALERQTLFYFSSMAVFWRDIQWKAAEKWQAVTWENLSPFQLFWIPDNSIYVHTWKRFHPKKLDEVTKSSQRSEFIFADLGGFSPWHMHSKPTKHTNFLQKA